MKIDIDAAENGIAMDSAKHLAKACEYNKRWAKVINETTSAQMAEEHMKQFMKEVYDTVIEVKK